MVLMTPLGLPLFISMTLVKPIPRTIFLYKTITHRVIYYIVFLCILAGRSVIFGR